MLAKKKVEIICKEISDEKNKIIICWKFLLNFCYIIFFLFSYVN